MHRRADRHLPKRIGDLRDNDDCDGDVSVTLCTIEGAGHCWPGQPCRVLGDLGESTTDIDANEAIWRLFSGVQLP